MDNTRQHWDNVYNTKEENEVSWFQSYPGTSIKFVELFRLPLNAAIIDVGGGTSHFVDVLLNKGYSNIYVLDISASALEKTKKRLGDQAAMVQWIVSDITEFDPPVQFDFWHDRATFHFLTTDDKIAKYIAVAKKAIKNNGYLVLETFSEKGPTKCSGLKIKQYDEASLSARFAPVFEKIKCYTEDHITPSSRAQNFLFCSFKKKLPE